MGFFDKLKKKKTEEAETIKESSVVSSKIDGDNQIIYLSGDINSNN